MQKMMPAGTLMECEASWKVRFFVRMRTRMCFKPVNELQCLLQGWKLGWFVQGLVCFVNSVHLACGFSCVWSGICSFFCRTVYWVISSVVLTLICERCISVTLLVSNEACIGETYSVTFLTYKLLDWWINYFSSCTLDTCKTHSYIHMRSDQKYLYCCYGTWVKVNQRKPPGTDWLWTVSRLYCSLSISCL